MIIPDRHHGIRYQDTGVLAIRVTGFAAKHANVLVEVGLGNR